MLNIQTSNYNSKQYYNTTYVLVFLQRIGHFVHHLIFNYHLHSDFQFQKLLTIDFKIILILLSNFPLIFSTTIKIYHENLLKIENMFSFFLITGHSNKCLCVSMNNGHKLHNMLLVCKDLKFSLTIIILVLKI